MTTLGTDNFAGANGSALSSGWVAGTAPTGSSALIQDNVAQLVTGTATNYDFFSRLSQRRTTTAANVVHRVRFRARTGDIYPKLWARADAGMVGSDGYSLSINFPDNNWDVAKSIAFGNPVMLGTAQSMAWVNDAWYFAMYGVVDSALKAKIWREGDPEPGWAVEVTDTSITGAGYYGLGAFPGAGGNTVVQFDDWSAMDTFALAWAPTYTDSRGLSDTGSAVTYAGTATDNRGLTDTLTTVLTVAGGLSTTATDSRGLSDTGTAVTYAGTTTDSRGLSDTLTTVLTVAGGGAVLTLNLTDSRGLSDAPPIGGRILNVAESILDSRGLSDQLTLSLVTGTIPSGLMNSYWVRLGQLVRRNRTSITPP